MSDDYAVDGPLVQLPGPRRAPLRLNLGCGEVQPEGWVNADVAAETMGPGVHLADVAAEGGMAWADRTFDYVVAHHVLQMLTYEELVPALTELRRVLANEGVLRLSVPSLLGAVRAHARGDAEWFPAIVGDETTLDGRFCAYVTWYGTARTVFTPSWLTELCVRAGFDQAMPAQHGHSPLGGGRHPGIADLDDREQESTYVEARR